MNNINCLLAIINVILFYTYFTGGVIFIKTHGEEPIELKIKGSDTVKNIKEKLETIEGIPSDEQALMLSTKELQDEVTLADYDIKSGSTINLV